MPVISIDHFTASGSGLEKCNTNEEVIFTVTTNDIAGEPCDINVDDFAVESKEAEIKSSIVRKVKGVYDVSYSSAPDVKDCEFFLAVTYLARHIKGSPFTVKARALLLEVSSSDTLKDDWLDAAVETMSSIPRARLWVQLQDVNGSEVYNATGETSCRWTQNHITAPTMKQHWDSKHTNIIRLDNGDSMMIIGKTGMWKEKHYCTGYYEYWGHEAYLSYNIIINKGYFPTGDYNQSSRRLIIARTAPKVPHWTTPENLISFSFSGFKQTDQGNWPKFNGTFRIYYNEL